MNGLKLFALGEFVNYYPGDDGWMHGGGYYLVVANSEEEARRIVDSEPIEVREIPLDNAMELAYVSPPVYE
jgi:hypothetical protein